MRGENYVVSVGLRTAALQHEPRERDAVGRFGGGEFTAVLAGAEASEAAIVAERICVAGRGITIDDMSVTASVGVSHQDIGRAQNTLEALLARADAAIYAANGMVAIKPASAAASTQKDATGATTARTIMPRDVRGLERTTRPAGNASVV